LLSTLSLHDALPIFYRHCRQVPSGTSLLYTLDDDSVRERRYWKFRLEPDPSLSDRDVPRLAEELRALFAQSVERRLMSDVPLGRSEEHTSELQSLRH